MVQEHFEELKRVLTTEEDILSRLLALAKDKNRILVSGDYRDLPSVTEKEERLAAVLAELEERRLRLMPQTDDAEPPLARIEASLPEAEAAAWASLRHHLKAILTELRRYTDLNRRILEEGIAFYRHTLSLLTGEDHERSVYAPPGGASGGAPGALVLDRSI